MSESSIHVEQCGDVTVAGFSENAILDMTTIKQVGDELHSLIDGRQQPKLVLDFSGVRFLSSQALGMLVMIRKKADGVGGKVVLAGLRHELARVFRITNLDKIFEFSDTTDEAKRRFGVN